MSNSNIKYLVLIIVNLLLLIGLYFYVAPHAEDDDPFDTKYVLDLIEKDEKNNKSINDLTKEIEKLSQSIEQVEGDFSALKDSYEISQTALMQCERQVVTLQQSVQPPKPTIVTNCTEQEAALVSAESALLNSIEQRKQLETQLAKVNNEIAQLQDRITAAEASSQQDRSTILSLEERIKVLESYLSSPTSIDKHYLGARFCEKPRFESLVCVTEFLVRPSFSRLPVTKLGIKVFDSKKILVATGEFASAKQQMYRLTLGRGKEVTAGDFTVEYSIDNQVLISEPVKLVQ